MTILNSKLRTTDMIYPIKTNTITTADIASSVNSILRIVSTLIIYVFHCNAHFDNGSNNHLIYAFSFFLFISGYYSYFQDKSPNEWIIKRFKKIYIPYWIVIIGVISANSIYKYKEIGSKEIFFAIIGGNLFIEHNLYVIAWFISVIICFYICVFIHKKIKNIIFKTFGCAIITILLLKFDIPYYFFLSFLLGYTIHAYISRNSLEHTIISTKKININLLNCIFRPLLHIQNYSYEFFLVHGGVILFFKQILHSNYTTTMFGGIFLSSLCAIMLKIVSEKVEFIFLKYIGVFGSVEKISS